MVKLFLANKDFPRNHKVTVKLKDGSVTDKAKLVNLFNSHCTNIVKNAWGIFWKIPEITPVTQGNSRNQN